MSVGGVFQLITNNGIQDRLIMATESLLENIKCISSKNLAKLRRHNPRVSDKTLLNMEENWMPTLRAIEKTHIMFINSSFKPFVAMAHEYTKTPPRQGKASLGNKFSFTLPIIGEFVNDMVMYVKITGLAAVGPDSKVRWSEFIGHRLCKNVRFKVQNQVFDEYTSDDQTAHFQFDVPLHKETGYKRNVGQEVGIDGYITHDPIVDEVRHYRKYGNGHQTFKRTQLDLEMWIPILFWFKDVSCSLPNFLLPMNQTDIEIEFESEGNLIGYAHNNNNLPDLGYTVPTVSECYLYINHIFLLPEINKIFVTRFGFQLIRVHRRHVETVTNNERSVLLHQLKWPIECLYIAIRPKKNLRYSNIWHKASHLIKTEVDEAVVAGGGLATNKGIFYTPYHVVKKLSLSAHDTIIYPSLSPGFYNSYVPSQYGINLKTPDDIGWYMMNFNLYPGSSQPSGHFNVSKARELYLNYESAIDPDTGYDIVREQNPCDLIVIAKCINFLLFRDGNAVLRFST
jgi:hypothetical protein